MPFILQPEILYWQGPGWYYSERIGNVLHNRFLSGDYDLAEKAAKIRGLTAKDMYFQDERPKGFHPSVKVIDV